MNKKQRIKQGQNLVNLIHPEMVGKEGTDKVQGNTTRNSNSENEITIPIQVTFNKDISPDWLMNRVTKLHRVSKSGFKVDIDVQKFKKYLLKENIPFSRGKLRWISISPIKPF